MSTELLVGTRKGLIVLREEHGRLRIAGRRFEGRDVEYACYDSRSGRYLASVTENHFGPQVWVTDDSTGEWRATEGPAFPEGADAAVERVWSIVPGEVEGIVWAGVAPAALFRSEDGGDTWTLVRSLWDQPSRPQWQAGGGGLALHSICPCPGEPDRLTVGMSAVGVWHTDDAGATWRHGNDGLVARYVPEEARADTLDLCVHNLHRAPTQPDTLYMQFHGGVYRSDDGAEKWTDIGEGLPSDFGFPMAIDRGDPDRAFVIPLDADYDRVTPEGKVRVYETRDRGATWQALAEGLPQEDAYLTVLRQAFCSDEGTGDNLGLYFGATSGEVFGSGDGGATWTEVATHLPPVLSVRTGA